MNIKSTALLLSVAAAASHAALWDLTVPDYQVQVPCVVNGSATADENGDGQINTYDCAGWWFGYGFGPAGGAVGTYSPMNSDGSLMTTDPADGSVVPNGNLTSTGIKITLNAPAGASDAPTGAGIGFQYNKPEGPTSLATCGGYVISYTATAPLQIELGWDEATNGYDTWFAVLPVSATPTVKTLPWDLTVTAPTTKISGAWKKDGWATGTKSLAIGTAVNQAWSLKVRLKNGTASAATSDLEIQSLNYVNTCNGSTAAIQPTMAAASLKAAVAGRTLSLTGLTKSANVEIISLQGKVMMSETVSAAKSSVNLSKLSGGMYIVRATGKDLFFSSKISVE
jgi:hypothetical protein